MYLWVISIDPKIKIKTEIKKIHFKIIHYTLTYFYEKLLFSKNSEKSGNALHVLQISCLIEDSLILVSASAFNLLPYGFSSSKWRQSSLTDTVGKDVNCSFK